MSTKITKFSVKTGGAALYNITDKVSEVVGTGNSTDGICTVFIRHTSASLVIQENADPTARRDLERWLNRLVPEHDELYEHTDEGPDDMPAHVKSALTATSLTIPIERGELMLGTWQGVYLWEHRRAAHTREIVVVITQ